MAPVSDKRVQLRIEQQIPMEIEVGAERHAARTRNLSLGGTFLETDVKLREGSMVKLRFSVPTQPDPILAAALVRWTEPEGSGVCFAGLRAREMWALAKFLLGPGRSSTA